jgi:hypothetical protein
MPDGFTYEGEWAMGEIEGVGTARYPRRDEAGEIVGYDVYEGQFVDGRRQGEGTMRYATGEEESGTWVNGALTRGDAASEEAAEAEGSAGESN